MEVRLGEHNVATEKDCEKKDPEDDEDDEEPFCLDPVQDIPIETKIKHKDFNTRSKINDIALLRLSKAVDFMRNNVRTICLPTLASQQIEMLDLKSRESMFISGENRTIFQAHLMQ